MLIDTLAALALGGTVALPVGIFFFRWVRRRDETSRWTQVAAMLDAEPGARLLLGDDQVVLYANRAGRLLWGDAGPPLAVFAARLAEEEGAVEALNRLTNAANAGVYERVDLPLRPLLEVAEGGAERGCGIAVEAREWWTVTIRPMAGATVWVAEDVTARRAIDDILLREREDLAEFLYFTPVGVFSSDSAGRFRMVNQRLAEWLGETLDTLLMKPVSSFITDGDVPEAEGAWRGVVHFRTRTGGVFAALLIQGTYDDGGEIRTRSVVVRAEPGDHLITANESDGQTNPALLSAQQQFRWLFEGAPLGLCLIDFEGVVSDCNQTLEKMCGVSRADLVDHPLEQVLAVEDRQDLDALMQRVALGEKTTAHREVRLGREGDRAATLYIGPMAQGHGVDGLVAYFIDATAQRTLEAQFAQAQKMQAMGQLAGGVAHDFNNLLTAMIGFCDLLLLRHGAGDPSFSDLMQIKQNANRAANLVRHLLAFSRKQPLTPRLLDPTNALTEMSHLLRRLLGTSIHLQMIHGRDVGPIRVDPSQFDQVIINLAVNARDAMPAGGQLVIHTDSEVCNKPMTRGAEQIPSGSYLVLTVTDTGTGIPRENLGRIFEPFFSTKTGQVGAGTGLGLSTVYGIIRQTGGFIFVDSGQEKGTTFTIYLPRFDGPDHADAFSSDQGDRQESVEKLEETALDPVTQSEAPPPTSVSKSAYRKGPTGGGTVLLVEDEDPVRVFAARALRNRGYRVLEARTGQGALEILQDGRQEGPQGVDVLITDMVMPGMDGAALARSVRKNYPALPVVLISGYSEEAARGDLTESVDFHFLPKPFSLKQLAATVKEVVGRRPDNRL